MSLKDTNNIQKFEQDLTNFRSSLTKKDSFLKNKFSQYSSFRILADLISGIAVGGFIGYVVDDYFNTLPFALFMCLIFGMIGGVHNCYKGSIAMKRDIKDPNA